MNVNISLYRTFCVVARNKSISKAAEELFVSQSAVTQSIKKIENDIDENKMEIDSYGFYISNHPASKYTGSGLIKLIDTQKYFDKYIRSVVLIESIKRTKTKNNEEMAFVEASDETGIASFVVFAKQIRLLDDLKVRDIAEFQGRVTKRYDKYQININNIIKK